MKKLTKKKREKELKNLRKFLVDIVNGKTTFSKPVLRDVKEIVIRVINLG